MSTTSHVISFRIPGDLLILLDSAGYPGESLNQTALRLLKHSLGVSDGLSDDLSLRLGAIEQRLAVLESNQSSPETDDFSVESEENYLLKEDLETSHAACDLLQSQVKDLQAELFNANAIIASTADSASAVSSLIVQVSSLETELEQERAESSRLRSELSEFHQWRQHANNAADYQKRQIDELNQKLQQADALSAESSSISPELLVEPAALLNLLKAKHKSSRATLRDVEQILNLYLSL
jgi:predicted  nucleic acid-binding Zn-ribbon protein